MLYNSLKYISINTFLHSASGVRALAARHPEIPWCEVAGTGNVLRDEHERTAPEVLWSVAHQHLLALDRVCRTELTAERGRAQP